MNKKKDTETKKPLIFDICYCPVCGIPRQKGNHAKCFTNYSIEGYEGKGRNLA